MQTRYLCITGGLLLFVAPLLGQQAVVAPPESLVIEGVPPVPASIGELAGRYSENRSAAPTDWDPLRRELLIATRFGNTYQAHLVKMPGGARQQLTFFNEPVHGGKFQPTTGEYMVFQKDTGGGEWYQLYRYDMDSGNTMLLTDGKSRNIAGPWSTKGDRIAYISTRRTGQDTDIWVINPLDVKSDHLLCKLSGGGWDPVDWSPDDTKLLVEEGISINETYLWLVDAATGEKSELTPRTGSEKVAYANARFSKDGKGIYFTCLSSIILSPPNGNVKMSPYETGDISVEPEGTAPSERDQRMHQGRHGVCQSRRTPVSERAPD